MGKIRLIPDLDISSNKIQMELLNCVKNKQFLHLCATQSIKEIRTDSISPLKKEYNPYTPKKIDNITTIENYIDDYNLFAFSQFQKYIQIFIYKNSTFISNIDQKHILAEIIKESFEEDDRKKLFLDIKHELFELYQFLEFHNIKISDESLKLIGTEYSSMEKEIFQLYNKFISALEEIQLKVNNGRKKEIKNWITNIIDVDNISSDYYTFQTKLKDVFKQVIAMYDTIVFDGFLFFNDLQRFIIEVAGQQEKEIIIITKYNYYDKISDFLVDENFKKLANELRLELEIPCIISEGLDIIDDSSLLNYLKNQFPDINKVPMTAMKMMDNTDNLKEDGETLSILKPFSSRDEELEYIAKDISNYLKENLSTTEGEKPEQKIKNLLKNDIAIVCAVDKEKYEHRLDLIFDEIGIFIPNIDNINKRLHDHSGSKLSAEYGKKIYYSKQELLNDHIIDTKGKELTIEQKYLILSEYKTIRASITNRPLSAYPIGQFIFQTYHIIKDGMTTDSFKLILFSNWKYNVSNHEKWDKYIADFKTIEEYFVGKQEISEWIKEIRDIQQQKAYIEDDKDFYWHPFNHISRGSLVFFEMILQELEDIVTNLKKVKGNVIAHIEEMKSKLDILQIKDSELEFEQIIINKIYESINQVGSTSKVKNISVNDFSENLKGMIKEWEKNQDEKENDLQVKVVNLENMQKFKNVYFIMLEAEKYPRIYTERFPFTQEIIKILSSKKFAINKLPYNIHGIDYHLKLERYLFKNVLDFTQSHLIITSSEKENNTFNEQSIFVEDIASIFNLSIKRCMTPPNNYSGYENTYKKYDESLKLEGKKIYTTIDIGLFLLCPHLYFHLNYKNQKEKITFINRFQLSFYSEAILYSKVVNEFINYSENYNKIYSAHNDEVEALISTILNYVSNNVFNKFSFLTDYEKKDIIHKVKNKSVQLLFNNAVGFKKYNTFKISKIQDEKVNNIMPLNGIRISNAEKKGDSIQYNFMKYLEFLILKTDHNTDKKKSIVQRIQKLNELDPEIDRMGYVNHILLNFDRNPKKYIEQMESICKRIEHTNFFDISTIATKYCEYCKINDICKRHRMNEVEDNAI